MTSAAALLQAKRLRDELAQAVALINADIAHQQAKGAYFHGSLAADTAEGAAVVAARQAERRERYYATRAEHANLLKQWKDTHR